MGQGSSAQEGGAVGVIDFGYLIARPTKAIPSGDNVGDIGLLPDGTRRRPSGIEIGTGGVASIGPARVTGYNGDYAIYHGRRANGPETAPTQVLLGDILGSFQAGGYGTTQFSGLFTSKPGFRVVASEAWTDAARGARLIFSTILVGQQNETDRLTLSDAGHLFWATDNTMDLGAAGATRPRTLYLGTSLFVGATKVLGTQGAVVADAAGGAVIDAEARTAINAWLARARAHGLIAT